MSSPTLFLSIARKARRDLRDIAQYGLERWGEEQQIQYMAALQRSILLLLDHPHAGRARDDLGSGYRSYLAGQHIILYRVTRTTLFVSRIVHARSDLNRALRQRS